MNIQRNGDDARETAGTPLTWRQKVLPACFMVIVTVYFSTVFLVFLSLLLKPLVGR